MKIKFLHLLSVAYLVVFFVLAKSFSIIPVIAVLLAFLIENFTRLENGLKNLFFVLAALSAFPSLLGVFLLYAPFMVFGAILTKKSFIRNYIMAYAVSFIPVNLVYLLTTYTSISLNYFSALAIFLSLPLIGAFILKKNTVKYFEITSKESIFFLAVLLFTTIIALNIVDDKNLFMANGVRIFTRVEYAANGLKEDGRIPIYNPGIAQGEATYLWNTPSFKAHAALANYLLRPGSSIYFFNVQSFFILFFSVLALGILLNALINQDYLSDNLLAVTAAALVIGLNFYFLHLLESFKANYTYPFAYLFLSIILENPKKYNDFLALMYISALFIVVHIPYGSGMLLISSLLFLIVKRYYIRDASELKSFFSFLANNKLKSAATLAFIALVPVFYISSTIIYGDFLEDTSAKPKPAAEVISGITNYFEETYYGFKSFLSWSYPDPSRIDDHKVGFFISFFGIISLILAFIFYKSGHTRTLIVFAAAYALNLAVDSVFHDKFTILFGGFWRTTYPYLLIILGASILAMATSVKSRHARAALAVIMILAFLHTIPTARANITNIHREMFASGDIYQEELDFIKKLPNDGRILTYGLFNNAVDFGGNYLTGKYFSRDERAEFNLKRKLFEKVHSQHSFGEPDILDKISGTELSNYLALGGYKYLFINICHPTGNLVAQKLYPDFTYPLYQKQCMVFLAANNTNYAEKVQLVRNLNNEAYKQKGGYKYTTLSPYYRFKDSADFAEIPMDPEPLGYSRISATEARISGNFQDNGMVVFKEYYFPRWRAFMGGKEVPVMATIHEMLLIKTIKGDEIILKYGVSGIEKLVGMASLIGHIGLILLMLLLIKRS